MFNKSNQKPCILNQTKISVIESIYLTEIEIKRTMVNLKLNKSMGPHKLGNHLLNKLANRLKKSLQLLFNTIANKSINPIMWKYTEICAIYKNGDKKLVIIYRPKNLLLSFSKVLERLIFDKISTHIFKQLHESQFGFWPKDRQQFKC